MLDLQDELVLSTERLDKKQYLFGELLAFVTETGRALLNSEHGCAGAICGWPRCGGCNGGSRNAQHSLQFCHRRAASALEAAAAPGFAPHRWPFKQGPGGMSTYYSTGFKLASSAKRMSL